MRGRFEDAAEQSFTLHLERGDFREFTFAEVLSVSTLGMRRWVKLAIAAGIIGVVLVALPQAALAANDPYN